MMKKLRIPALYSSVVVAGLLLWFAPQGAKAEHSAVVPAPREASWVKRHEGFVAVAKKGGTELLLLGDSITDFWTVGGKSKFDGGNAIYAKEFKPLKASNFGIGGDRTEHVLWRLQNGELDGIKPKVVMLLIGTNNLKNNSAEEIAAGISAIVKEIHKHSPQSKVLLLGIFPRDAKPSPSREKIKQVNGIIVKLDDGGKTVKYLDIGPKFLQPDGAISKEIMRDFLHLTEKGYEIWADAVREPIRELLDKK